MFSLQSLAVCFLIYVTFGDASVVPFIKPCKPDDTACMKESAIAALPVLADGYPPLGLPPSDPIVLQDVRADDKDLKLGFRNMKVTGAKKCKIMDLTRDLEKSTIRLVVQCPLSATGQYTLDGKILFLKAEGDGDFHIKSDKTNIDVTIKITPVEEQGVKYWKITGFDYSYDMLDNPVIELTNLFGGDETRAKPLLEAFQKSAKELIMSLGNPIIEELMTREVDIMKKLMKKAPASDLEIV